MSAVDGSIRIDTKINTTSAEKGVKSLYGSIGKLGGLIASVFAVTKIISFAKSSVSAYGTQLEAEQQLITVLKNRYNATQDLINSVYELTAAQQAQGVVGDEVQMAGLKTLGTYVSKMEELTSLTGSMNDLLAFQYGYNASAEGAKAVGKAMGQAISSGSLSLLKRMGIAVDEATEKEFALANESKRVAMLQELVADKVGGVNEALAKTPYGRIVQLKNAWGDFKEQVGQAATNIGSLFVPALTKGLNLLTQLAAKLIEVSQALQEVFLGSSHSAIKDTAEEATKAEEELAASIEEVGDAIAGNLAGFDELNIMAATTTEDESGADEMAGVTVGEGSEVNPDLISSCERLKAVLEPVIGLLKTLATGTVSALSALNDSILKPLFELLTNNLVFITGSLQTLYDNGIKPIASAINQYILPRIKELIEGVKDLYSELYPLGAMLIEKISPALSKVGTILSMLIGGALGKAVSLLRLFSGTITDLIAAIQGGGSVGDVFAGLVGKIETALTSVLETVTGFFEKHGDAILNAATTIIEKLVEGILTYLPKILEAAANILSTLIQGISANLPRLINTAVTIITTLVQGLMKALPQIVQAAVQVIVTLVQTLLSPENISALINAAVEIVMTLFNAVVDNLPYIIEAAISIIMTIVETLLSAEMINTLINAIITIITTLLMAIIDNLPKIIEGGIKIVFALVQGLINAIPQLIAAIPKLISAIINTIFTTNWLQVGIDIIKGIGQGLIDGVKNIGSAIGNACKSIWSSIKGWFGIKSPSKLMKETVGVYIAQGIGEGFVDEIDDVSADMEQALSKSIDFSAATGDLGNIEAPKFDTGSVLPYKVVCDICEEKGRTLDEIRNAVDDIADDVRKIRDNGGEVSGEITVTVTDADGNIKAQRQVEIAKRENRKAGKTVLPVGE